MGRWNVGPGPSDGPSDGLRPLCLPAPPPVSSGLMSTTSPAPPGDCQPSAVRVVMSAWPMWTSGVEVMAGPGARVGGLRAAAAGP